MVESKTFGPRKQQKAAVEGIDELFSRHKDLEIFKETVKVFWAEKIAWTTMITHFENCQHLVQWKRKELYYGHNSIWI